MRLLISLTSLLVLAACSTAPNAQVWKPDYSLITPCDPKGPLLAGGDGMSIVLWGVEMRKEYEICAARHRRLVEAIPKEK